LVILAHDVRFVYLFCVVGKSENKKKIQWGKMAIKATATTKMIQNLQYVP